MILQSLVEYYEQLVADDRVDVPQIGWCSRQVSFVLELSDDGRLVNVIELPAKRGLARTVPAQKKRSSGVCANTLCDTSAYFLGVDEKGKPDRARECFEASRQHHVELFQDIDSDAARAVCLFFSHWDVGSAEQMLAEIRAPKTLLKGGNLVFSYRGSEVLEDERIKSAWNAQYARGDSDAVEMTCLVTGERGPIARLHPAIKGVWGAQTMGASLVGFNARAFESYGHEGEQGANAPVSEYATFAYTTALNYLLSQDDHHIRLGDTTVVYWASRRDEDCARIMELCLNPRPLQPGSAESSEASEADLDNLMKRVEKRAPIPEVDMDATFHVLGLAPNAARLAVRFFHVGSFGDTLHNINRYYRDIAIAHAPWQKEYVTPYRLLASIENPNSRSKVASSVLVGGFMEAILARTPYPEALFQGAILRTRATQDNDERHLRKVTRERAAIIKAYLIRNKRRSEEEVTVVLNETRGDVPYVLGRLFFVLEDIQYAASNNLNATVKNRYFDSAMATPAVIFPILYSLSEKHLRKLYRDKKGLAIKLKNLRDELLSRIEDFPARLAISDQGTFILGYTHQMQAMFKGNKDTDNQEIGD